MSTARTTIWGFLAWLAAAPVALGEGDDPRELLDRMGESVASLNYEGIFVHIHSGQAETMEIVHQVKDGKVTERLVSLDGADREIIRSEDEVRCIFADKKAVLVERRKDKSPLISTLPNYSEKLDLYYRFEALGNERMLNRSIQIVAVESGDQYRYGYKLWLDRDTAMPLKSQLIAEDGHVVEQILFTDIGMPDSIPDAALKPSISVEGFQWFRTEPRDLGREAPGSRWRAARVPPGFELASSRRKMLAGSDEPVDHLVYSDGLASVSVFVELSDDKPLEGFSEVGAANAFSTVVEGFQVTAVGEVPQSTVRLIAESVGEQTLEASR